MCYITDLLTFSAETPSSLRALVKNVDEGLPITLAVNPVAYYTHSETPGKVSTYTIRKVDKFTQ